MARSSAKRKSGSRGRAGFGRALKLLEFLPVASRIPTYARLVTALVLDDRMPAGRKALLAGGPGLLVVRPGLFPGSVPLLRGRRDLGGVVLALDLFLARAPEGLLAEELHRLCSSPA